MDILPSVFIMCILIPFKISPVFTAKTYDLTIHFCKMRYVNPKLLKVDSFNFKKVNRTNGVLNVEFELLKDISEEQDASVRFTLYQFRSGEYKKTPISLTVDYCKFLMTHPQYYGSSDFLESTGIKSCPVKKGIKYNVRNYSLSSVNMPELLGGNWMMEVKVSQNNQETIRAEIYAEIIPK